MIVFEFFLTLLTIYVPAFAGLLVFGGIVLFGLQWVDRTPTPRVPEEWLKAREDSYRNMGLDP